METELFGTIKEKLRFSSSRTMARNSGNGVISMVIMFVFLVLLLIPKIATYDEV